MRKNGDRFELSATDLSGYLNCHHFSALERAAAEGTLIKPQRWDPLLETLWQRGSAHEQSYIDHLTKSGLEAVRIDGREVTDDAVTKTTAAMKAGTRVIVQEAFSHEGWIGRADILARLTSKSGWTAQAYILKPFSHIRMSVRRSWRIRWSGSANMLPSTA